MEHRDKEGNMIECPRCGSDDVRKLSKIPTLRGRLQRYLCINGHTFYEEADYVRGRHAKKGEAE